jgi:hypothetical protein
MAAFPGSCRRDASIFVLFLARAIIDFLTFAADIPLSDRSRPVRL